MDSKFNFDVIGYIFYLEYSEFGKSNFNVNPFLLLIDNIECFTNDVATFDEFTDEKII